MAGTSTNATDNNPTMDSEEWRDIKGYEGSYMISNFGRIKTLDRKIRRGVRVVLYKSQMKKLGNTGFYNYVPLSTNGKSKNFYVHRLVAAAFIPNPNNLPQVNHKDGDRQNNHVDNLEWCDGFYNQQHSLKIGLRRTKRVLELNEHGEVIREYPSTAVAAKENMIHVDRIYGCFRRGDKKRWIRKDQWIKEMRAS